MKLNRLQLFAMLVGSFLIGNLVAWGYVAANYPMWTVWEFRERMIANGKARWEFDGRTGGALYMCDDEMIDKIEYTLYGSVQINKPD